MTIPKRKCILDQVFSRAEKEKIMTMMKREAKQYQPELFVGLVLYELMKVFHPNLESSEMNKFAVLMKRVFNSVEGWDKKKLQIIGTVFEMACSCLSCGMSMDIFDSVEINTHRPHPEWAKV